MLGGQLTFMHTKKDLSNVIEYFWTQAVDATVDVGANE